MFVVVLAAVGFMSCGGKNDVKDPQKEEPKKEDVLPGNDYVVYEANEKLFAATDALKAVDARLDEIEALGVNVLWLMPIHPVGVEKTANSPYCVRDYKAVHPAFGTLDDLRTLVQHAHDRKMKVILDWIANHTAWDNAWVKDHPDWYTGPMTNDEKAWQDVTFLNYSKPEVRAAMIDALTYWVKEADIDGYRCDYAQGVPDDFWAAAIKAIRAINPNAIMLAETSRLQLFEAGFDWMYSWNYLSQIQRVMNGGTTLAKLYSTHDSEMSSTPEGKQRMRYITNHDACSEQANQDLFINTNGMLSAACLTYFLGGIPLIYSSQEVGYLSKINFFTTNVMNWNSNPDYQAKFQALMKAYKSTNTLRGGRMTRYTANADVACFTYSSTAGTLLVIANTKNASRTVAIPESLRGKTLTNMLTGAEQTLSDELSVPAFGYFVLSTEKMPSAIIPVQREAVDGEPVKRLVGSSLIIENAGVQYSVLGQKL